jgi:hypothetical protein
VFANDGSIRIKGNPSLCFAGPREYKEGYHQLTIEACVAGDPFQSFYFRNESFYPTALMSQGANYITNLFNQLNVGTPIVAISSFGAWISPCDTRNVAQNITFTAGSSGGPGLLQSSQNLCLSGKCEILDELGCAPVKVVPCDPSDASQLYQYSESKQVFVSEDSGLCLGVLEGTVCLSRASYHRILCSCSAKRSRSSTAK